MDVGAEPDPSAYDLASAQCNILLQAHLCSWDLFLPALPRNISCLLLI